jgi:hypothetical protein
MRERHALNFHKICRAFSVFVLLLQRSLSCAISVNAVVNFHYNFSYDPSTIFVVYCGFPCMIIWSERLYMLTISEVAESNCPRTRPLLGWLWQVW